MAKQSAEKRARQAQGRRLRNRSFRSAVKSAVRKFEAALGGGDQAAVLHALTQAVSTVDRAAQKGAIHRNVAARHKSRLFTRYHKAYPVRDFGAPAGEAAE